MHAEDEFPYGTLSFYYIEDIGSTHHHFFCVLSILSPIAKDGSKIHCGSKVTTDLEYTRI